MEKQTRFDVNEKSRHCWRGSRILEMWTTLDCENHDMQRVTCDSGWFFSTIPYDFKRFCKDYNDSSHYGHFTFAFPLDRVLLSHCRGWLFVLDEKLFCRCRTFHHYFAPRRECTTETKKDEDALGLCNLFDALLNMEISSVFVSRRWRNSISWLRSDSSIYFMPIS